MVAASASTSPNRFNRIGRMMRDMSWAGPEMLKICSPFGSIYMGLSFFDACSF